MPKRKSDTPRGILDKQEGAKHFQLSRFHPSPELVFFVEHYWIVRWDLRGKDPFSQDVLSHPSVHLVFEEGSSRILGVVTGKFTRRLEDKGKVLGIKFRPGGFYPFFGKPVASFTDDRLSFDKVFDEDPAAVETEILAKTDDEEMAKAGEAFLKRHLPDRDSRVESVSRMVESIKNDPAIIKVDDAAERFEINKRSLQRLFRKYVGATPKWVIQRYRLHEAAEKMAAGEPDNWPQLALELGYFDQAHFIRDFKSIVGQTPAEYAASLGYSSAPDPRGP